ncbi:MAG TPA: hypothetical protein VGE06_09620 [Flavisolibacter sp.]
MGNLLQEWGVTDVFKMYSEYQLAKQNNVNASTINDLKTQIATMSGYVNGQNSMKTTASNSTAASAFSAWMPFILLSVVGVAAVVVLKK